MLGSSSDSSLPPLIGAGGGPVCESVGKEDLLSAHFDGKQSRDPVDLPSTCHPRLPVSLPLPPGHGRWSGSCWISIPMVALTHWECFLFFLKKTAVVLAPHLAAGISMASSFG